MESNFYYSPSKNAFYLFELKSDYESSKSWPSDAVAVEQSVFDEFSGLAPNGKTRSSNKKGMPIWIDYSLISTKEELIEDAEQKKKLLLAEANNAIAPLQDAMELDMATDEELSLLKEWKRYRVLLNRVDTSNAPDIEFPEKP